MVPAHWQRRISGAAHEFDTGVEAPVGGGHIPFAIAPRVLVERFLDLVDCGEWRQLPELYADDALIEFPLAQPVATRLDGRNAIRAHFERARIRLRVIDRKILETSDPEVIVADYRYDGGSIHSERRLIVSNIQIFRIRLGKIITSRDFHDHAALSAAMGSSEVGDR